MCYSKFFLTKLLSLGVSFSTAIKVEVVAKLLVFGILPLISFILVLGEALVAKLVILTILTLTPFILALTEALEAKWVMTGILSSISFLTTGFFLLPHLLYLNQQEQVLIFQYLI